MARLESPPIAKSAKNRDRLIEISARPAAPHPSGRKSTNTAPLAFYFAVSPANPGVCADM
jgi:hypothetical protein